MKMDIPSPKTLWMAVSGQVHAPPLAGSLLIYVMAFLTCLVLQHCCRRLLPPHLYSYVADFCFTLLVCTFPYGHGPVRANYGHAGYLVAAVTMVTMAFEMFEGVPSPLGVFVRYLKGEESLLGLGVRVVLQVVAAFLSYRLVFLVCCLEVTKEHQMLLQGTCESDLKVPVMVGCLIEFLSVLYDTWLCHQQLFRTPLLDTITKNTNGALLVCAGVHLTGMYMHPAMASALTFNCKDTNALEHIAVYWIAAFLGCLAGVKLSSVLRLPYLWNAFAAKEKREDEIDVTHSQNDAQRKTQLSNGHFKDRLQDHTLAGGKKMFHNNNTKPARRHRKH